MEGFQPKKSEKIIISMRISVDTLKQVDEQATEANISRNEFIVQCVEYALSHRIYDSNS